VRTALYAGSFDPIHRGHVGIIERAAAMYNRVVVAVLANPEKPPGMFLPADRVRLVEEATQFLGNVSSVHFYGLTVDLARSVDADVLVRAAHKEQANEFSMAAMNWRLAGIETIFVAANPETMMISSSLVRGLVDGGQLAAAQELVPACVRPALAAQNSLSVR
jgi:pantetheine-phosphate adenylyltransferase